MKTNNLYITLFAALAIAACSKGNGLPQGSAKDPNADMPNAYTSVAINIPHTTMTKATSGRAIDQGIADENKVKTLHVFIYGTDAPNTLMVAEFTVDDNSLALKSPSSSTWVADRAIKTKKADKYIFAAMNLNTDMVNYIVANGFGSFSYDQFAQEISQLADPTNGSVMFNTSYPESTSAANLYENESLAQTNHMAIPVSCAVAKAAVFKANDFVVNGGGNMTEIKFGWRNLNKKFYFIQDKRDGVAKDYNREDFSVSDLERGSDAINTYTSTDDPVTFSYAPEDSFKYSLDQTEVNGATFIGVSGVFTPDKVISTSNPSPTQPADFAIISNPDNANKTFYVVRAADGTANYFVNGTIAQQYADLCSKSTSGMPLYNGTYVLNENIFTNGICYFHTFVNASATSPQTPYNVYRNQYFKVNIHSVQAPENPSDNFDTGEVIKPETWISTDIEITPWEVYEEDYDLWPTIYEFLKFICEMKACLKRIVLITWSFTMVSCIKENLPECAPDNTGIVLKFRYPTGTNTPSNKNGIDRLPVFISDDESVFVSQISDSLVWIDDNYELELPYKRGGHQFVTWAGYNEITYGITICIPGQTHIEDLSLFLKRDTGNRVTDQLKLLYHRIYETAALDEHEKMITRINLKQITNHIRVTVHNLDKDVSHNIYIEDNNGKYGYSSSFAHDDPILCIPVYMRVAKESSTLTADFNIMRLDKDRIPRLQIVDETNTVCYDENLIGELLGKNPNVNLENEHDFTIEVPFNGYSPIDIKISGWDIKGSDEM